MLKYLLQKGNVKFAICGRNRAKLEKLIEDASAKPEILVLDVVAASQAEVKEGVFFISFSSLVGWAGLAHPGINRLTWPRGWLLALIRETGLS